LQKERSGGIQNGAAHAFEPPGLADQVAGEERTHHAAAIDTTNGLDLRTGKWLPVRHYCQYFKGGGRKAGTRLDAQKACDCCCRFRSAHQLHAFAIALQAYASPPVAQGQFSQGELDTISRQFNCPCQLGEKAAPRSAG
jgi:hypothetical protein